MLILLFSFEFFREKFWFRVILGVDNKDLRGIVRLFRDFLGFFLFKICNK